MLVKQWSPFGGTRYQGWTKVSLGFIFPWDQSGLRIACRIHRDVSSAGVRLECRTAVIATGDLSEK